MTEAIRRSRSRSRPIKPAIPAVKPTYDVPKWAGKPPQGMHLDVLKDGKLIEKFIVDGKTHFFFGRQREFIDFTIEHTSCSRVHAVMVYHQHLQRMFLIDLGSTHGTFLGTIRLEPHKPIQLPTDESFSFGASTRTWTLREKPPNASILDAQSLNTSETSENETSNISLLGLPEAENDLNDLTEFNTAHNRRLATLPIDEAANPLGAARKRRRSSHTVSFSSEETIINPEDVDPTIGRFRNLVSTEIIIPNKKGRTNSIENNTNSTPENKLAKVKQDFHTNNLYGDNPQAELVSPISMAPKISSAPDVEAPSFNFEVPSVNRNITTVNIAPVEVNENLGPQEPMKKKYVKEAWPGRKPKGHNLLSV